VVAGGAVQPTVLVTTAVAGLLSSLAAVSALVCLVVCCPKACNLQATVSSAHDGVLLFYSMLTSGVW
jgi:hypothetical protein